MEYKSLNGVIVDEEMLNSFSTLGIEPTSNLCAIRGAYRNMARLVHPDKCIQMGLGWDASECRDAFNNIRDAHNYLISQFKYTDVPDYDIIYLDSEFDEASRDQLSQPKFNCDEFNKKFISERNLDLECNGENRGWPEFANTPKDGDLDKILEDKKKIRSVNCFESASLDEPQVTHDIVQVLPFEIEKGGGYTILGEDVKEFTTGGVGGLCGSDLGSVYNNNMETWEKSAKGVCKKFDTGANIKDKYSEMLLERENLELNDEQVEKIKQREILNNLVEKKRIKRYLTLNNRLN